MQISKALLLILFPEQKLLLYLNKPSFVESQVPAPVILTIKLFKLEPSPLIKLAPIRFALTKPATSTFVLKVAFPLKTAFPFTPPLKSNSLASCPTPVEGFAKA